MNKDVLKKLREDFEKDWNCSCGSVFEPSWLELVSKTKTSVLARYLCQICGREQMFAVSTRGEEEETPHLELPKGSLTANDVLDIRSEIANLPPAGIKALQKKKTKRVPITKQSRP